MGFLARQRFDGVWSPDSDAVNARPTTFLRGDNLILNELDVPALRRGSSRINTSPFAELQVHSLYTTALSGTRYRMAGVGAAVYANGVSLGVTMTGSGDTPFGFHLGQILFARGTTKKKYDGTTVRNWGIAMTGAKPTAVEVAADEKTFATCASGESPAFTEIEGDGSGLNYTVNHYPSTDPNYSLTGAIGVKPDTTLKLAIYEKEFSGPQDFTTYNSGTRGTDDDIISWYLAVPYPKALEAFAIQIDVNDGNFVEDYFMSPVLDGRISSSTTINPGQDQTIPGGGAIGAAARAAFKATFAVGLTAGVPTVGLPNTTAGGFVFQRISFRRGDFTRLGKLTNGKGWDTVKAVRILATGVLYPPSAILCSVDTIRITSAKVFGEVEWKYIYVRNASGYQAKSSLSPVSDKAVFSTHAATVTVPADTSRDSQVNEIWLYRKDQFMDTFYRSAVKTGVSGTGSVAITDNLTSDDVLTLNIKAELDNVVPPDNIIGIAGPHFDRTLVLTSDGKVWPSRRLDPDAFATGHALSIGGADETPQWIFRAHQTVYVGTTKDIYEISGTGAENPDGSIEFTIRGLSMDHRPLNPGIAHEGDQLCFFSDDGWRAFQGQGTILLTDDTSLLYRNQVRHGVGPVYMAGRVRAALGKGELVAITPEGISGGASSCVLYRRVFARQRWYRHTYGSANWLSIHREPDGTLIAGDDAGFVWVLDTGTQDDGADINVTVWTKADDLDKPYQRKKVGQCTLRVDTGADTATIAVYLNGTQTVATTVTTSQNGIGVSVFDFGSPSTVSNIHEIAICRQIQLRLTGSFSAFHWYDHSFQFRERPVPMIGRVVDILAGSPGIKKLSGFQITCNTLGVQRTITPFFDGVADGQQFPLTTSSEEPETHTLRFDLAGRNATDIGFSVDGEIEIDAWSPIVTHREPVGVKVWDSGPIDIGRDELTWLRGFFLKVRARADLVITPYFDDQPFQAVVATVSGNVTTVLRVPVGPAYVGRQPRVVVTSCDEFFPYFFEPWYRETGRSTQKKSKRITFNLETSA